jgi:hypothetical protein
MDLRASLDDLEKRNFFTLPEPELQTLGRPARNQSLYRLRYPGSTSLSIKCILTIIVLSPNNVKSPI